MQKLEHATFAGGCFWCMVAPFDLPGVIKVVSGYTGGHKESPTYEEVCSGTTGHREAVEVTFDPARCSYEDLLEAFWQQIDPTDPGGQFNDRGASYRTAVFYHSEEQRRMAEDSKRRLAESGRFNRPIVTEILPASTFYPAEEYHQDYHRLHPTRYRNYRLGSGRQSFLDAHWRGKNGPDPIEKLTPLQYEVTQKRGTEPPFQNEYWDNSREGIYVDIVSGEPLFSSLDKYDAGCGWPSFTKPLHEGDLREAPDTSHGMDRTEVRSARADSHLGHRFTDGPQEHGGRRYCVNSAALRFIAKEDLAKEGYGQYRRLFDADDKKR